MTPENLELLRTWVQAECRHVYYKLQTEDTVCDDLEDRFENAEWNEICKQSADSAFLKVVIAFCGTD